MKEERGNLSGDTCVLPTLAGSPVIYVMRMWITPRAMEARSAVRTKLELVFGGAVREIPSALSFQKRLSQQSVCFHGKRNLDLRSRNIQVLRCGFWQQGREVGEAVGEVEKEIEKLKNRILP
jgi:hypothetical protein